MFDLEHPNTPETFHGKAAIILIALKISCKSSTNHEREDRMVLGPGTVRRASSTNHLTSDVKHSLSVGYVDTTLRDAQSKVC